MPSSALPAPASPRRLSTALASIPFPLVHVLALGVFWTHPTPALVGTCVALYVLRMWAVTAGYHRYFSHRTFKTSRFFQFALAFLAESSGQKGVLWWASHHRHHHRMSDQPGDTHSPVQDGFLWSHVGWIMSTRNDETKFEAVKDLARFPELRWLNRYHYLPPVLLGGGLFLAGGWPLLVWGMFLSTVFLWHGTFIINSLCHVFGSRRYETTDASRNNLLFALVTLGEGWHNNHHHYQSSVRQGFFWWEIDVTYYALKLLSWLGLVWDLREPPESALYPAGVPRAGARIDEPLPSALDVPQATA